MADRSMNNFLQSSDSFLMTWSENLMMVLTPVNDYYHNHHHKIYSVPEGLA